MTNIVFQISARTQSAILVDREFLEKCMGSDLVAETIEKVRSEVKALRKKKFKLNLPAVMIGAYPTEEALAEAKEVAKKTKHRPAIKRQMENFQLTGFFQYDVDHLKEELGMTPEEFNKRFFDEALPKLGWDAKERVVMTFKTCSGDGWKAWIKGTPGSSIVEDKHKIDEALGIKADENVLDKCHICFLPSEKLGDIYYKNLDILFNDEPLITDYRVGEEFKYCNQKAASTSSSAVHLVKDSQKKDAASQPLPEFFKNAKWQDIADAFIQLKWGERPKEGERNAKLFDLAQAIAHITDNRPKWVYQVLADEAKAWGLDEKEIKTTIESACKKPLETRTSKMLEKAVVIAQQRNMTSFVALAPELMKDEMLPPVVRILTSRVMFFQRAPVATMMFTWLGTYVRDLYIKDVDGTIFENASVSFCIGESSVGKNVLNILYKAVCERLINQTKDSENVQLKWNEDTNTADGEEKKKPKRPTIPFPVIDSNSTAAFVRWALYNNDKCHHTQAIVHVNEFEQLYQLVNDGGQFNICTFIKQLFDRDEFGAKRFTAGASNYTGPTRVNITGAGTLAVFKKMFRQAIIDGTLGRADLLIMEQPEDWDGDFVYGDLGKSLKKELKPYIDKLVAFTPERDEDGDTVPLFIPEAAELSKEIIAYIKEYSTLYDDGKVYKQYAFRTNKMVYNKIYLLYILNDMKWDNSFADFYRWNFHYSMFCKMRLVGQMAKVQLEESAMDNYCRRKSPLAALPSTFTRQEAEKICKDYGVKDSLTDTLSRWKIRKQITTEDGQTFHKTEKGKMVRDI